MSVWLCDVHRDDAFLEADGGQRFATDLAAMWHAAGAFTAQRSAALSAHTRRITAGDRTRPRPGSYAWRTVRRDAERRFASGEDPRIVIAEILESLRSEPAVAPSVRTMQRWYTDARWLSPAG